MGSHPEFQADRPRFDRPIPRTCAIPSRLHRLERWRLGGQPRFRAREPPNQRGNSWIHGSQARLHELNPRFPRLASRIPDGPSPIRSTKTSESCHLVAAPQDEAPTSPSHPLGQAPVPARSGAPAFAAISTASGLTGFAGCTSGTAPVPSCPFWSSCPNAPAFGSLLALPRLPYPAFRRPASDSAFRTPHSALRVHRSSGLRTPSPPRRSTCV
jgi:hypothetical protein